MNTALRQANQYQPIFIDLGIPNSSGFVIAPKRTSKLSALVEPVQENSGQIILVRSPIIRHRLNRPILE